MMKCKGIITEDMTKCHTICLELLRSNHVLIAGTTGSGKSVMLNSMIYTAMRTPVEFFFFIDLKRVELSAYKDLYNTYYYCNSPNMVCPALDHAINIMEDRFAKMEKKGQTLSDELPIYIFVDELADLITQKGVLDRLVKIGRLGRAAKVHLICATQDPSRRTLPAALMQNFTATVALRCRSSIESRQIIGIAGAEFLPQYGRGIMWDYRGTQEIDIPLTPKEDIRKMCIGMCKEFHYVMVAKGILRTFFKGISEAPYSVDPAYWERVDKGLAAW